MLRQRLAIDPPPNVFYYRIEPIHLPVVEILGRDI